jgi:hypothetical protein
MPRFQVLRRVDAFVDYTAEIEAATADEAAAKANDDEAKFEWKQRDVAEFDSRLFVTLDEEGNEMESTQRGDF